MAEIVPLGNGVYRIVEGTSSRVAYAAGPAHARWVFLEGRVYVVDAGDDEPKDGSPDSPLRAASLSRRARTEDRGAITAPMPATVVAIPVEAGQRVSKGDVLIVLEAMKMELPLKAPRDGTIKAIACRPGELVQPGIALLELE